MEGKSLSESRDRRSAVCHAPVGQVELDNRRLQAAERVWADTHAPQERSRHAPLPFPGFCRTGPQTTWTAWPRSAGSYVKFMDELIFSQETTG